MKRIGRKWAAAAMALAAGLMTAGAVEPVLDNLPGAPGQSRSYWEAVRAEAAAKKAAAAAKAASTATATAQTARAGGDFFTGKPYDADLGGYVFKYRTYDPHLGRWTTPDPSGFPDGANGYRYSPTPLCSLDPYGLFNYEMCLQGIGGIGTAVVTAWVAIDAGAAATALFLAGQAEAAIPAYLGAAGAAFVSVGFFCSGSTQFASAWSDTTTWIPLSCGGAVASGIAAQAGATREVAQAIGNFVSSMEAFGAAIGGNNYLKWAVSAVNSAVTQLRGVQSAVNETADKIENHREFIPATNGNGEDGYE